MAEGRYWLHTLGCPKNQVDSDKLEGTLAAEGYVPAEAPGRADLLVVNTCAFIEAARAESVEAILAAAQARRPGARLVVTGCLAERHGAELAEALPEVDLVAPFGTPLVAPGPGAVPLTLGPTRLRPRPAPGFDLLELPRPASAAPWAYVKVAEGCDRHCGFCAIPSFRGRQRSRRPADVLSEVDTLVAGRGGVPVREVVLVAQDLASYGRDRAGRRPGAGRPGGPVPLIELTAAVTARVERTRLLYLYPSQLTDPLVEAVLATGVPYFDLSLQHVARGLLAKMARPGDGDRFLGRIAAIRAAEPDASFRSSFILGYPGETEEDHDQLLAFLAEAELDWAGFFPYSAEDGTPAATRDDQVPSALAMERLRECAELQDAITARRRSRFVGRTLEVLVDRPGQGRSVHEAPEIDGVVRVPPSWPVGSVMAARVTEALGPDLVARAAARVRPA
jgi:ribosomal protein S12 methylthiotransferase